jgi:hypothetical protein
MGTNETTGQRATRGDLAAGASLRLYVRATRRSPTWRGCGLVDVAAEADRHDTRAAASGSTADRRDQIARRRHRSITAALAASSIALVAEGDHPPVAGPHLPRDCSSMRSYGAVPGRQRDDRKAVLQQRDGPCFISLGR